MADAVDTAMAKVSAALDAAKVKELEREVEGIIAKQSRVNADAFNKRI